MGVRIATGLVLIGLAIVWLFFVDYAIFTMGALLIYMVAAYEMGPLLGFKSKIPFVVLAAACSTIMFMVAPPGEYVGGNIPHFMKYLVLCAVPFWIAAVYIVKAYPNFVKWHENKAINCLIGMLMLLPFLQGLLILRATNYALNPNEGAFLVLAVMALVWASDTGAYFTGRTVGKNPLMPEVSPKKTREGMMGGVVFGLVVMYVGMHYQYYSIYGQDQLAWLAAGFGAIIFSVFGDLMESVLKRMTGIKDSGKILPGHGGVLDRIDSQLAAVPMFLSLYWLISGEVIHG